MTFFGVISSCNNCLYYQKIRPDASSISIRRSELISKEEWQKCKESLEKKISELEDSHKKDKQIKHGDIVESELITENSEK